MITLTPLPFGRERARKAAHRHVALNLALQVLREASARSAHETVGTLEVRLALHVLRPHLRETTLLTAFWRSAIAEPRHVRTSCLMPYRHIAQRLIEAGAPVEEENRP